MTAKAVIFILLVLTEGTLSYIHSRGYREIARRLGAVSDSIQKPTSRTLRDLSKPPSVLITQDTANPANTPDSPIVSDKTPLLFLPGLDGIENYSSRSIDNLNVAYDVWRMTVSGDDRSSFIEIASVVLQKLETFDKPAIIVGESFGGLLATYIALRAKKGSIAKLVLVNPATSFYRTSWPLLAPVIANSGVAFPFIGIVALLTSISDASQIQRVGQKLIAGITSTETVVSALNDLIEFGRSNTENISPETLNWRISKWFGVGASLMNEKYSQIVTPTLILIGKNDRLLPSRSEGKRLLKEMTSSAKVELKEYDIGHALLED